MDKETAKMIRGAVEERLQDMGSLGVDVELKGGSYSNTEFNLKITFRDKGAPDKLQQTYELYAKWDNLLPIGSYIDVPNGRDVMRLKIIGFDAKKRKYPIIAEAYDGSRYKLPKTYAMQEVGK